MSRLFDALQRPEGERSDVTTRNPRSLSVDSPKTAATDENLMAGTSLTCSLCNFVTPENSLFCPKCNSFLGSVVMEGREFDRRSELQKAVLNTQPRSTWGRIRRVLTLGLVSVLTLLLYGFRTY